MTTPGILAYIANGTDGVTGVPTSNGLFWPSNNQFFHIVSVNNGAADGMRQFTAYVSGDESLGKNLAALGVPHVVSNVPATTISPAGRIVFISTSANLPKISCVDAQTLTLLSTFGPGTSVGSSSSTQILSPASANILVNGAQEFVVFGTSYVSTAPGEINMISLPNMPSNTVVSAATTERQAMIGTGPAGSIFIIGRPSSAQFPSTASFGLYTLSSGAVLTSIGKVAPSAIDATWTHFTNISPPAFDQTDGNPIVMVSTADSVTNKYYMVKLNGATAAVIWTIALNNYDSYADSDMARHTINNSTLYFLDSADNLITINTSAGTSTSTALSILSVSGGQISEDYTTAASGFGSLFLYGGWAHSATTPTYLGTYMGTLGNHSISNQWMRWIPAEPLTVPPPIPPPAPFPTVSTRKAWTYVQDGHTFYVLDLGAEGTFVYDVDTKQWSQFLSTSTSPNWNMCVGVMWGQRVVAGDLASGQVYELDPGVTKDDGNSADIPHTATGGLVQRSRTYLSVAALRLALSLGYLGDSAGVNITLSYSDDNGNTWSTPVSIALSESDYTTEVAFRSLGAFAAPGRIFSITDTGGPLRIDGCDADIDDFDDDSPQQKQQ